MTPLKTSLNTTASALRLLSKAVANWPWVLAIICILSPISPHVRLPYELSGSTCDYIGTRGIISKSDQGCPPVVIIDTRSGEAVTW